MDDSFPIILIHRNDIKKEGSLKDLTLLELTKEATRLFREECKRCDVKYWAEDDFQLQDDEDIEEEYAAMNGDFDYSYYSDNSVGEQRTKIPIRIRLTFSAKKIPNPVGVRVTNIGASTVVLEWRLATHKLARSQVSSLSFEITQMSPHTLAVTKCNPTVSSDERYQIKLSGFHPATNYKFHIRSVLQHQNNNIHSDTCEVFAFETSAKSISSNSSRKHGPSSEISLFRCDELKDVSSADVPCYNYPNAKQLLLKIERLESEKRAALKEAKLMQSENERLRIQKANMEEKMNEDERKEEAMSCKVTWEWQQNDDEWIPYNYQISKELEKLQIDQSYIYQCYENGHEYKIKKHSKEFVLQINTGSKLCRWGRRTMAKIATLKKIEYPSWWSIDSQQFSNYGTPKLIPLDHSDWIMWIYQKFQQTVKNNRTSQYGQGTYFARNAKYSLDYAATDKNGISAIFCCAIICGESTKGDRNYKLKTWPKKSDGFMYDTLVDNISDPKIYVIHENARYNVFLRMSSLERGIYSPHKIQITVLAILSILHYYFTITIVYELGWSSESDFDHLYEISLIIIVFCMLILVRVSIHLSSRTSHLAFIAVILAPMLTVFMRIDECDLYFAHLFQTFFILLNCLFHLIILCVNMNEWLTILCFMSFMDGISFVILTISLLFAASYQNNKLLPCNILFEITLLMFTIIVIGMSIFGTQSLFYFTLIIMINYFIFNVPFLKTYLIWQYMYHPAKETNFNFIITNCDNNINKIIDRLYAQIHCMSHDIKWQWTSDENTKLLQYNGAIRLKGHEMDSCECWRLQYKFTKLNMENKRKYIQNQYFAHKYWTLCQFFAVSYGMVSLFAYIYPIAWFIVVGYKGFIVHNIYQLSVIYFVITMYILCLLGVIVYAVKYTLFVYIAMVYYVSLHLKYDIYVNPIHLMDTCLRMQQVHIIMDNLQTDIALIILLYCYRRKHIKCRGSVSLDSSLLCTYDYPLFSMI